MTSFESYILVFSLLFVSYLFIEVANFFNNESLKYKFLVFLGLSIPVLLAAFRNSGTDLRTYYNMFFNNSQLSWTNLIHERSFNELGNTVLLFVTGKIGGFNLYLFTYSALSVVFIFLGLKNFVNKRYLGLSFFLYLMMYYPTSLNIMRQSAAVAVIFFGYKYIFNKKLIKYILCVLLASTFHISVLFTLPFYFLIKKDTLNKKVLLTILTSVAILTFSFSNIITMFSSLEGFERYDSYSQLRGSENNYIFFLNLVIFLLLLLFKKGVDKHLGSISTVFFSLLIIGLGCTLIGYRQIFLKRISSYTDIGQLVLIPYVLSSFQNGLSKFVAKILILLLAACYFYIFYFYLGFGNIFPMNFQLYK